MIFSSQKSVQVATSALLVVLVADEVVDELELEPETLEMVLELELELELETLVLETVEELEPEALVL